MTALKPAYQLVLQDLVRKIKKAPNGSSIRFPDWGTFVKQKREIKAWDKKVYVYWKINFRISDNLKRELDKQL